MGSILVCANAQRSDEGCKEMILRKIYYIDVGNLPREKAEAFIREAVRKHKAKLGV
jgi:hypothetical protein